MTALHDEVRAALYAAGKTDSQVKGDLDALKPVLDRIGRVIRARAVNALLDVAADLNANATGHQKIRARTYTTAAQHVTDRAHAIERGEIPL